MTSPTIKSEWRKSSRSGSGGNECVELRVTGDGAAIRDTKSRTAGTLALPPAQWSRFLRSVKTGQLGE